MRMDVNNVTIKNNKAISSEVNVIVYNTYGIIVHITP